MHNKAPGDAEAIIMMAIAQQGVEGRFYVEVPCGQYKAGDKYAGRQEKNKADREDEAQVKKSKDNGLRWMYVGMDGKGRKKAGKGLTTDQIVKVTQQSWLLLDVRSYKVKPRPVGSQEKQR